MEHWMSARFSRGLGQLSPSLSACTPNLTKPSSLPLHPCLGSCSGLSRRAPCTPTQRCRDGVLPFPTEIKGSMDFDSRGDSLLSCSTFQPTVIQLHSPGRSRDLGGKKNQLQPLSPFLPPAAPGSAPWQERLWVFGWQGVPRWVVAVGKDGPASTGTLVAGTWLCLARGTITPSPVAPLLPPSSGQTHGPDPALIKGLLRIYSKSLRENRA